MSTNEENIRALKHLGSNMTACLERQREDEADRYGKICEAQFQLKDIITQFDESGMFIVAAELRIVEKRVNDMVENLSAILEF